MLYISSWINCHDIEDIYFGLRQCDYDKQHHDVLIKEIIEHNYVICGDTHQSYDHNCIPLFNDGYLMVSQRTWGEIMAEAINIKLGKEEYNYKHFYITSICPIQENRPGEEK